MKILILGASGMLGSTLFRYFSQQSEHQVFGTLRNVRYAEFFTKSMKGNLLASVDVLDLQVVQAQFESVRPDLVINCVGLIKQDPKAADRAIAIQLNALLPHQLAVFCEQYQSRLIQISTDCVFTGKQGNYRESDISDAEDIYGRTKYLGEIPDKSHVLTLRTSIIGPELDTKRSLLEWFLSQTRQVQGYRKAIFSGLPTIEIAHIIDEFVLKIPDLSGLFHVASNPINKYELLKLTASVYNKKIKIVADDEVTIDRSLNADAFNAITGYISPPWQTLLERMYKNRIY